MRGWLRTLEVGKVRDVQEMQKLHPKPAEKKGKKKKEKGIETDPFGNMESFWGMEKNPISIRPVE